MNKFKKFVSALVVYMFTLTLLPVNALAAVTKDKNNVVPQYLNYNDKYVRNAVQYKDKLVIETGKFNKQYNYGEETLEYQGPVINIIDKDDNVEKVLDSCGIQGYDYKNAYLYNYAGKDNYIFNAEKNLLTETKDEVPNSIVGDVYNSEVSGWVECDYNYDYNYNYNYGNQYYVNIYNNKDNTSKQIPIEMTEEEYQNSGYAFFVNNQLIMYDWSNDAINLVAYIEKDGKYQKINGFKVELAGYNSLKYDSNNNLWALVNNDGKTYAAKFENGSFVYKYEVDSYMDNLSVYDDEHLTVWGDYGYTMINKDSSQNPTPGDNTGNTPGDNNNPSDNTGTQTPDKPVVNPSTNNGTSSSETGNVNTNGSSTKPETVTTTKGDTTTVEVSKPLETGKTNTVEVKKPAKVNAVKLNDIASIKTGKGEVNIKIGTEGFIKLPFSVLSTDVLKDAKSVTVKESISTDDSILKSIKGVNKVFNFDLIAEKNDGSKVTIHNFASGKAEITLNLTDADLKGLDRSKIAVFYYNEKTGKFEMMPTTVNGNSVTFTTTHFSKYIVAEKAANKTNVIAQNNSNNTTVNNNGNDTVNSSANTNKITTASATVLPKTGSIAGTAALVVLAAVMIGLGVVTLRRKNAFK